VKDFSEQTLSIVVVEDDHVMRRMVVDYLEEHNIRDRVTGGGRPPPVPTERSVQISRTTLFRR